MNTAVFWIVAPYSLVEVYRRFRVSCCLHHEGDETSVNFYQFTRGNMSHVRYPHNCRREIQKSNSTWFNVVPVHNQAPRHEDVGVSLCIIKHYAKRHILNVSRRQMGVSCQFVVLCMCSWRWRQYRSLKRRKTSTNLHGAATQKTAIFVCRFFVCSSKPEACTQQHEAWYTCVCVCVCVSRHAGTAVSLQLSLCRSTSFWFITTANISVLQLAAHLNLLFSHSSLLSSFQYCSFPIVLVRV
jgi:hypothetical protein